MPQASTAVHVRPGAATGPHRPRSRHGPLQRAALLVVGALTVATGVATMAWVGLGVAPLDATIIAVAGGTSLPVGIVVWLVVGSLILVAWALGGRPGPGTVAVPVVVGPTFQAIASVLEQHPAPSTPAVRLGLHVVAVAVLGTGAAMVVVARRGAGVQELLASATATRLGVSELSVRSGHELLWVLLAIVLGGPVGLGTVVFALLIGPVVARVVTWLDGPS